MNQDFVDLLSELSDSKADFLIVGAHALAVHGVPRATGDLDIWIRPSPENAKRVWKALQAFGASLSNLAMQDLTTPGIVFQIGVAPCRIDIMTEIDGVEFEEAWVNRIHVRISGLDIPVIGREEFLKNKRAVGRPQDLADVASLEGLKGFEDYWNKGQE